jgi:hypothetical protein
LYDRQLKTITPTAHEEYGVPDIVLGFMDSLMASLKLKNNLVVIMNGE